jgi:hypothetical protein
MTFRRSLLWLAAMALGACGRIDESDKKAAVDCVKANLAAMEKGDVKAVLATIHPESPAYLSTPELIHEIVSTYKLKYTLEEATVERVTNEGVHVRFVQVTKRISGPAGFPDNRVEGMHMLRRDGKLWKIWYTQVRQARTLDGMPMPVGGIPSPTVDPTAPPAILAATPIPVAPRAIPLNATPGTDAPKAVPVTPPSASAATPTVIAPRAIPVAATPRPLLPGQ